MKKIMTAAVMISFIAAIFASCTNSNSPTPTQTPAQKILGKWTMSAAISNSTVQNSGNFKDTTKFTPADYFNFKADSTVAIMADGVAHDGKWKIVNNKVVFTGTNYMDVPLTGWAFPILTSNNLEFYYRDSTATTDTVLKLDLIK